MQAIASLITQVSPTGQPARAPLRAPRGAPRGPKKPATSRQTTQTRLPKSAPQIPQGTTSTSTSDDNIDQTSAQAVEQPSTADVPTLLAQDNQAQTQPALQDAKASYSTLASSSETAKPGAHVVPATTSAAGVTGTTRTAATGTTMTVDDPAAQNSSTAASSFIKGPATTNGLASTGVEASAKRKKRKGFWGSLFSSCFGGSIHDEEDQNNQQEMSEKRSAGTSSSAMTDRKAATAGKSALTGQTGNLVAPHQSTAQTESSPVAAPLASDTTGTSLTAGQKAVGVAGAVAASGGVAAALSAGNTSSTSGSNLPPSPARSEISPEILAATSKGGAALPIEETEGVLSGAVQAPGSEAQLTPTRKARRRSGGEASSAGMTPSASRADLTGATAAEIEGSEAGTHEVVEDSEDEYMDEDERIIAQGGVGIPLDEFGNPRPLLVELTPSDNGRKCLVLDLDETLVHSSFKLIHSPDFVVPVEIENTVHNVYVIKRPGVDAFMKRMGEIYEVVVFTASLSKVSVAQFFNLTVHG